MHLLRLDEPAFLLAPLTKRVCIHIAVTDAFPRPAILTLGSRIPVILFISLVLRFPMFLTKPAVRQPWTAGVGAGTFWFSWHRLTSLGHKKSPHRIAPVKAVFVFYFAIVMISQDGCVTLCQTVPTINAAIDRLASREEQLVLRYRYLDNCSWEEISRMLNVSLRTVHRIHGSALQNFSVSD